MIIESGNIGVNYRKSVIAALFLSGSIAAIDPAYAQSYTAGSNNTSSTANAPQRIANRNGNGPIAYPSDGTTTEGTPQGVAVGDDNDGIGGSVLIGSNNQAGATGPDGVSTLSSVAIGNYNRSSGGFASSLGIGNLASGPSALALGVANVASGNTAIAIGRQTTAAGAYSMALGNVAQAGGNNAIALGNSATASGARSIAIGSNDGSGSRNGTGVLASGADGIGLGTGAQAIGDQSTAIGFSSRASGIGASAVGYANQTTGAYSTAFGTFNTATSDYATAIGVINRVNGLQGSALGYFNTVNGSNAGAFGSTSTVAGDRSYSVGFSNIIGATTADALAFGNNILLGADATGAVTNDVSGAVALGSGSSVLLPGGVALGQGSIAGTAAGIAGYDPATGLGSTNVTPTWRSTLAAVSVGNGLSDTRQITGVAAGATPTDAVNVAQLTATNDRVAGSLAAITTLNASVLDGTVGPVQRSGTANLLTLVALGATGAAPGAAQRLGNIAAGTSTNDAVNVGQLQEIATVAANGIQYDDAARSSVTLAPGGQAVELRNVAAGAVAANSTDAVNGSQLNATNQQVADNTTAIIDLDGRVSENTAALAGINTQLAATSSTIGTLSTAIATGRVGLVQQTGGAVGTGAITIGASTGGSTLNVAGTSGDRGITGVAAGVAANDAVNVEQLAAAVTNAATGALRYDDASRTSLTLNAGGTAVAVRNVAAGSVNTSSTDAINGSQLAATNQQVASNAAQVTALVDGRTGTFRADNAAGSAAPSASGASAVAGGFGANASAGRSTAIGSGASASGQNSIALGYGSTDGGVANVVSVGASGAERQVTNVASGTRNTDAVNLGQLGRGLTDTLGQANAYTDTMLANVKYDLGQMGRRIDSGDARNAAMAGIPQAFKPGQGMIGFGVGGTGGDVAIAFGASKAFSDEHTIAKAGVSYAGYQNRVTWQVGAGYAF